MSAVLTKLAVSSRSHSRLYVWEWLDWVTGIIAGLISFAVYAWSAAPNVTLLDSGEFVVAAQHFGVPHPTGYPLWTLLNWLFLLLPLGNAAWEVAIFSGLCAALAVGLCAALLSSIQIWCYGVRLVGRARLLPRVVALSFSLMLAFSESMWSQAVIAEVYALHALLIAVFLVLCYSWVQRPASDRLMLGAFFALALSFSNHQLTMTLAPLPFLLILLLRRRAFIDWLFAGVLTLLLGYLAFAILSEDPAVLKTAIRFFYCVALAFGLFVWIRKGRLRWRLIAFLPIVVAAGLLPYAYMPLASSTNPPMNWGYARNMEGFFFSINRSQYPGSLSVVTVKSLGRLMGTSQLKADEQGPENGAPVRTNRLQSAQLWVGFFWQQLIKAFSIVGLIGYFASFVFVFRLELPKRVWIYLLHIAFVLAAFLQPLTANSKIDNADWWTQMPYHTYTNLIFATLSGLGIGLLVLKLAKVRAYAFWLAPLLLILPFLTFAKSEAVSGQRDRWFGWMYGHDMLKDLPPDSVVIGGTDPGRFVPTYMIFGESLQPAGNKRDRSFDRRDLYIITQNALGETNYMKYLRDQYTTARPKPSNALERWLGREGAYPPKPLVFPTEEETEEMVRIAAIKDQESGGSGAGTEIFGVILRWLWEKNRDQHEFFIEESFPIRWTYDYAVPHGLLYRLNKTRLETLPKEVVERDFAYWRDYSARLLGDPNFKKDFDAQRSFSKLRQTIANIYRHRRMSAEAERAYREALALWPGNTESIVALTAYLWDRGDFEEAIELCDRALADDPNSIDLWRLRFYAEKRRETEGEIRALRQTLASQPKSGETLRRLIELYSSVGDTNKAAPLIDQALISFPEDADMLRFIIRYYEENGELAKTLDAARRLTLIETSNVHNYLLLARACFVLNKKEEFYEAANHAIRLGGPSLRKAFISDPKFSTWRDDPEFQKLTEGQSLAPN
ncbi:MAG TPA: DUF2723 domain-containing protein [Terrimicrobiaceae bacterium]